jgi:adenylate kinase
MPLPPGQRRHARDAVAAGTELGKQAKDVMARGELVSDGLVINFIEDNI